MSSGPYRYDVFLSYRHLEPDQTLALELAEQLRASGLRVALDRRTFEPEEPFLNEMDRCIAESQYTVALLSARYLASGDDQRRTPPPVQLDGGHSFGNDVFTRSPGQGGGIWSREEPRR